RFAKETQGCAEAQAKAFETNLARVGGQVVARTRAGLEPIPKLVENLQAEVQQTNSALDATMNHLNERVEGFRTQAQEMNAALGTTMTRLAQKVETCRAQAEELNSTLGSSLTNFSHRTAEMGQTK